MSLGLLFPLGLAALAAWLLPLLVHLARREEQRPTDFAALRWLSARLRPRQKLRFEEWLLLAVRLVLIAALALLLARPVLLGGRGDAPWLLVMPGPAEIIAAAPAMPEDTQRRWLAPGFPPLDSPRPQGGATTSLLRQLDAELPAGTPVTVLATTEFDGADGELPRLSRTVDWRVVPVLPADVVPVAIAPFSLAVRHADAEEPALRYLRAANIAWQVDGDPRGPDVAATDAILPATGQPLAWLAPGELPAAVRAWTENGGRLLIDVRTTWPLPSPGVPAWRDADGRVLAHAAGLGRGRVVQLQAALAPASLPALLEPDFPARLRALMEPAPPPATRADAMAHRPLPGGASFPETPRELVTPVLWLIAALFALERWLATGRRETAP